MKKILILMILISAIFGWDYWVPYCNTFHIPGEMSWSSSLSATAIWDSTDVHIDGVIDTMLMAGRGYGIGGFTDCGTKITTSKPVLALYSMKITTATEYEPTEYYYCLLPSDLLGTDYYISSMHTPAVSHEYIGFTSTADGNTVRVNGSVHGTYDTGDCDTVYFSGDVVYLESDSPIAVAHVAGRVSGHDDFFGYSVLPTSRWGTFYTSAPMPELWGAGYVSPEDSSRIVITALDDATSLDVAGTPYSLDSGDKLVVNVGASEFTVVADKPVQVVRYFWIIATDPWHSSSRRWYSTATLMASDKANTKSGLLGGLPSSTHGGPQKWYTLTSLKNDNNITIDVGYDGTAELDTTLDSLETLAIHDTISILPGSDTLGSRIEAEKPIQLLYERRGWWSDEIEGHANYTFFIPSQCGIVRAECVCPPPMSIVSCDPAAMYFRLWPPMGTDIDTMGVYLTLVVASRSGSVDTTILFEPSDSLRFSPEDSTWMLILEGAFEHGDTVRAFIDSIFTLDGCLTIF